jgi:hypothetical protein
MRVARARKSGTRQRDTYPLSVGEEVGEGACEVLVVAPLLLLEPAFRGVCSSSSRISEEKWF